MVRFEMNYKKADMNAFFNDIVKKGLVKKLLAVYSLIGGSIFLIFMAVSILIDGKHSFKPIPFIFLGVFIVLIFLAINRTIRNVPDKMYRDFQSAYDGGTIICTFTDDRVWIESNTENNDGNGQILYSALEKAIESDNYFYIFVDLASAQIIKKDSIVEGTIHEVENYLKQSLGNKYINISKYRG